MKKPAWWHARRAFPEMGPGEGPKRIVGIKSHGHPLCRVSNTRQVTAW